MNKQRPILVAGRTGQVAQALQIVARERGLPLVALGRPDLDIENAETVSRAVEATWPDLIVNAAAYTAVDLAESEPQRAFAVNRDGAGRLAAAAAAAHIPHIHISTDYVFDGHKATPYSEDDTPSPLGAYGRSKLEGEAVVRDACPHALVLRTSWIYSPHGQNFVKTMLRLAQSRKVVKVVDDQHGAPTAAHDIACAILDLRQRLQGDCRSVPGDVYHLAAEGYTTWHGLAAAIFANWSGRGRRVPVLERLAAKDYPAAAERPANSRLDCSKVERTLGIRLPPWQRSLDPCLDALATPSRETR